MIDWYYHDPGEGRIGPLSAEELRKRFDERRIQRDTLVWHHGLREWQPLERMAVEIGLERIAQDASQPPPLPSGAPAMLPPSMPASASAPRMGAAPRGKYSRAPLRQKQKKTFSTGAIVAIVIAVLAVPTLLVFGSLALSGYRDYALRASSMGAISGLSNGLKQVVGDYALHTGRCPSEEDPRVIELKREIHRRASADVRFASIDGGCAFEVAINADGKPLDGKSLRYEGHPDGNGFAWQCRGGDLPRSYRPNDCRDDG